MERDEKAVGGVRLETLGDDDDVSLRCAVTAGGEGNVPNDRRVFTEGRGGEPDDRDANENAQPFHRGFLSETFAGDESNGFPLAPDLMV